MKLIELNIKGYNKITLNPNLIAAVSRSVRNYVDPPEECAIVTIPSGGEFIEYTISESYEEVVKLWTEALRTEVISCE
jgi:hypothetical protein